MVGGGGDYCFILVRAPRSFTTPKPYLQIYCQNIADLISYPCHDSFQHLNLSRLKSDSTKQVVNNFFICTTMMKAHLKLIKNHCHDNFMLRVFNRMLNKTVLWPSCQNG